MMIDFKKQILKEIESRGLTINQAALAAGVTPIALYNLRNGRPMESKNLEKILNSMGAELKFKKGAAK